MEDWPKIVADHGESVWQAAFRLLGNEADAADCVQETFVAAVKIARQEPVRTLPALLRRVGNTQALCILRKRLRRQKHHEVAAMLDIPDTAPSPVDRAQASEAVGALRAALARLPAQQAAVFSLRFLENLSYEQIAEALGLNANAVGVLLHRAKGDLRRLMTDPSALAKQEVQHG
jgi:RNA polymerase sigma-70 factor, ECF subfamily